ncbi:MAG: hypothetical protein KKE24_02235 [Candidatus Thermoplasmatota archaeon]|nr:hypothetical protein [Candidatus Thermoplasmatota archaeon]
MTPKTTTKKADAKGENPPKNVGDRFVLIELSCKDTKCSPCTYPNCQRFARYEPKKKPYETKMSKMFEIRKPVTKPEDTRERMLLVELSCKDEKCSPCTYPNCQRFVRADAQTKKKVPFKVKVTEIEKGADVKKVIAK